mmetsp:Transcript_25681/g.59863  ORF Transcript_25681/g.59863 Transcript_25681/m.59863 type:complete len:132 (-) Transcript_25681:89-484(-)
MSRGTMLLMASPRYSLAAPRDCSLKHHLAGLVEASHKQELHRAQLTRRELRQRRRPRVVRRIWSTISMAEQDDGFPIGPLLLLPLAIAIGFIFFGSASNKESSRPSLAQRRRRARNVAKLLAQRLENFGKV